MALTKHTYIFNLGGGISEDDLGRLAQVLDRSKGMSFKTVMEDRRYKKVQVFTDQTSMIFLLQRASWGAMHRIVPLLESAESSPERSGD
jgi:hypothetical protein